jgi:RHS repeat-associated protein
LPFCFIHLFSGSKAKSVINYVDDTITLTNTIANSENAKVIEQIITQSTSSITIENQDNDKIIYNYDQNGNIIEIYNNEVQVASYVYDGFNQLVRENDKPSNKTTVYKYDNNGNILSSMEYDYTVGNLGEVKRSIVYGYSTSEWKDLLETYDNQTITYDANGNPIQYRDGIHLTWTNGRLLANYQSDICDITYKYNYDGLRTSKTINNVSNGTNSITKYYYDKYQLIKEISDNDIIWYLYDIDGLPVGFVEFNGNTYYYEKNIQGDIIKIYDTIGNEVVSYTYDAWGEITSISGNQTLGEKNPFRYRGYYYDKETGFYYVGSRYYDPNTGRFINTDEPSMLALDSYSLLSPNLFAYCINNPVNYHDPDGHSPEAIAVGGSTFAAFCAWLEVIGGANWWNPVGWTIAGILATGVITWAGLSLYNQWKASASSKTKVLSDVNASIKSQKVYYLAYVNSVGELIKVGKAMCFVEALTALGITGATNTLSKVYKYNRGKSSNAQRELQKKSDNWGIYTHDQSAAKALAVVLGAKQGTEEGTPKVHSSGMYGHYHDSTHTFHIWFGGKIVY